MSDFYSNMSAWSGYYKTQTEPRAVVNPRNVQACGFFAASETNTHPGDLEQQQRDQILASAKLKLGQLDGIIKEVQEMDSLHLPPGELRSQRAFQIALMLAANNQHFADYQSGTFQSKQLVHQMLAEADRDEIIKLLGTAVGLEYMMQCAHFLQQLAPPPAKKLPNISNQIKPSAPTVADQTKPNPNAAQRNKSGADNLSLEEQANRYKRKQREDLKRRQAQQQAQAQQQGQQRSRPQNKRQGVASKILGTGNKKKGMGRYARVGLDVALGGLGVGGLGFLTAFFG
jgi:hypothetical protein